VAFGIFVFTIVVLTLRKYGEEKDAFQQRVERVSGQIRKGPYLDEDMNKPFSERLIKPVTEKIVEGLKKVAPQTPGEAEQQDARTVKLKTTLRQGGMKLSATEYRTLRLLILIGAGAVFALLTFLLTRNWLFTALGLALGVYLGYVIMRFQLSARVSKRKASMQRQLPEVLDMISVSVEAGLGLEQAMIEVVSSFEGPLIDEIAITNREMAMGRTRTDALLLLGERCGIEEMQNFTRAIVQATQMGIAVKNVLRSQSEYMRQTRKNKVEEKAMQVSVKILLPMAGFILPVIFIVLLGPAAVKIMDTLFK
jgi:tight adherence protein C